MIVAPEHASWYVLTQVVIAFFWAVEPEALMLPVWQAIEPPLEEPEAPAEPLLSEPQAARARAPASSTAAARP